jgi:membrane protein
MTRLERALLNTRPVRIAATVSGNITIPGTEGLSLRAVARIFFREIRGSKLNVRSAAVTYNFLMAIPPTLLILCSLVPYLPLGNVQDTITGTIPLVVPNPNVSRTISGVIIDFMTTERKDLLSFGIILTAFFSSNGMMGLMRSFDRQGPVYRKRSGLVRRWTAIKLTFMLLGTVILTLAALIVQSRALNTLILRLFGNPEVVRGFSLMLVAALIFVSISVVYTYGPSLTKRPQFVSPGSVFATILCIVATFVFFYLVNNFIHYNKVYGSIGTLIAFMAWMYINTLIILIGYEINVSILLASHQRSQLRPSAVPVA